MVKQNIIALNLVIALGLTLSAGGQKPSPYKVYYNKKEVPVSGNSYEPFRISGCLTLLNTKDAYQKTNERSREELCPVINIDFCDKVS